MSAVYTQILNGRQQFFDDIGPLVGGTVYFYVPGTTTPKDTFQDVNGAALNTNPITLDGDGSASIWGAGQYRQVVYDILGNLVWDEVTQAVGYSSSSSGTYALIDLSNVSPSIGRAALNIFSPVSALPASGQNNGDTYLLTTTTPPTPYIWLGAWYTFLLGA